MLNSMTGFARETADSPFGTITCELRAVNHRFLDVQFRLPDELRPKEIELRGQIGESVKRGKVECALFLRRGGGKGAEMTIDESLVRQIGRGAATVADLLPDTRNIDPVDVLRWPGVVSEAEIDAEPLYEESKKVIEAAVAALVAMRSSEGQRILAIAASVRERMPSVLDAVRSKLLERIEKLDVEADPARLETELALIAQKLDVDEEVDRLESHVSEVRTAMKSDEPVGRRLDFLMQELNREANTLGSKSADTETTKAAVDLKVLIEQMREQIQNVE
jgi:uncharacterized protein (TIGR00255 family)